MTYNVFGGTLNPIQSVSQSFYAVYTASSMESASLVFSNIICCTI